MKTCICTYVLVAILVSCNSKPSTKIQAENDSLQTALREHDARIEGFIKTFDEVKHILDSITLREKSVVLKTEKITDLKKPLLIAEINTDIHMINELIKKNSRKIEQLNSELKAGNVKNQQLQDAIRTLNTQIVQKENELATLNSKLTKRNLDIFRLEVSIGVLYAENAIKDETIQALTEELYTAFYITGTSQELEKEHIIDKKGGLLGIGKTQGLNNNFDASQFTRINYTETTSIPLNCIKAELITSHPTDSYRFEKDKGITTYLIITDADAFWKASKYLVVVKKVN